MQPFSIPEPAAVVDHIRNEIRRSPCGRYHHRLHVVMLVAQGMPCSRVAEILDEPVRTVQSWVAAFLREGSAGLHDRPKPGRTSRLSAEHRDHVRDALARAPVESGWAADRWEGEALSAYIKERLGTQLSARQCLRLIQTLAPPVATRTRRHGKRRTKASGDTPRA